MCLGVSAAWKGLAELHSHTKSFSASSDCRRDVRCALRSATQNRFISPVCPFWVFFHSTLQHFSVLSRRTICTAENHLLRSHIIWRGQSRNSNYWGIINLIAQVFTFPHWALVESRMGLLWHGTQASGPDETKGGAHNQVIKENWRRWCVLYHPYLAFSIIFLKHEPFSSSERAKPSQWIQALPDKNKILTIPLLPAPNLHLLTYSKVRAVVCTADETDQKKMAGEGCLIYSATAGKELLVGWNCKT